MELVFFVQTYKDIELDSFFSKGPIYIENLRGE
jgi:hypothetical protein